MHFTLKSMEDIVEDTNKKELPEKLYRYREVNDHLKESLTKKFMLFFASPKDINDPFDCKLIAPWSEDIDEKIEFYNIIYNLFHRKFDVTINRDNLAYYESKYQKILGDSQNKYGILSLSKLQDNTLLWSHYSDGHKGVCLEFNLRETDFENNCECIKYGNDKEDKQYEISELKKLPSLSDIDMLEKLGGMMVLRKSRVWIYEKEWRILLKPDDPANNDDRKRPFREEMLTGVFFGYMMSNDDKLLVLSWLKDWNKKPKIYLAKKDQYNYKLNFFEEPYEKLKAELCPQQSLDD